MFTVFTAESAKEAQRKKESAVFVFKELVHQ
ncbi:MAG: hypothetical protein JWP12_3677 [Bacteroidetes bacterium]|nr:hypothetical protein [Bacteroidota bacterium]